MPELPEVETILRGLSKHLVGQTFEQVHCYQPKLRLPVPTDLPNHLCHHALLGLSRRGKYLRFHLAHGCVLMHFGMSGKALLRPRSSPRDKHNHVTFDFVHGPSLCYIDPRRFGLVTWSDDPQGNHPLLNQLGIEPLEPGFDGEYLSQVSRGRKTPIKSLIMNAHIVTGVGNIYATEALFHTQIHPLLPAQQLGQTQCTQLAQTIQAILHQAILKGGTTLKDFASSHNTPGYFQQTLSVYGRKHQPCHHCHTLIETVLIAQRTSAYCPRCQPMDSN